MIEKWISIHTDNQNEEKLAEKLDIIDQNYKSFRKESNSNEIDLVKGKHLSNKRPHINDDEPKQLPIMAPTHEQDIFNSLRYYVSSELTIKVSQLLLRMMR